MPTNNNNDNSRRRSGAKPQIDTKYAHLQPQDIGLERVVLGALMVDSDAFSMVSEMLKPSTFYEPGCGHDTRYGLPMPPARRYP